MNIKTSILFAFAALFWFPVLSFSQDTAHRPAFHPIRRYTPLPTIPQFPGGRDSLVLYIKKHTCYPRKARKHHIKGVVEVDFTVATDGSLKNIRVLKPLGYGCDKEAIKVVKHMPRWLPGMMGRNPMQIDYHVNIPFGVKTTEQNHL